MRYVPQPSQGSLSPAGSGSLGGVALGTSSPHSLHSMTPFFDANTTILPPISLFRSLFRASGCLRPEGPEVGDSIVPMPPVDTLQERKYRNFTVPEQPRKVLMLVEMGPHYQSWGSRSYALTAAEPSFLEARQTSAATFITPDLSPLVLHFSSLLLEYLYNPLNPVSERLRAASYSSDFLSTSLLTLPSTAPFRPPTSSSSSFQQIGVE